MENRTIDTNSNLIDINLGEVVQVSYETEHYVAKIEELEQRIKFLEKLFMEKHMQSLESVDI